MAIPLLVACGVALKHIALHVAGHTAVKAIEKQSEGKSLGQGVQEASKETLNTAGEVAGKAVRFVGSIFLVLLITFLSFLIGSGMTICAWFIFGWPSTWGWFFFRVLVSIAIVLASIAGGFIFSVWTQMKK